MDSVDKTIATFMAVVILLATLGIGTMVWYSHNSDQTFVKQCSMAGGTAVISGTNKCYREDHLLYSDSQQ